MRYLRMLSNSAFAGALAAVYLTLLLLYLNPAVPLAASAVWPLLAVTMVTYGAHIAVVSYALYVLRQIALTEPSSPGWISLRLLTWTAGVLSAAAGLVTWLHASGLRNALDPHALPGLRRAAFLFAGAAAVFLLLGVAQVFAHRRGRAAVAILFTATTTASIVVPFAVRDTSASPREAAPAPPTVAHAPAAGSRVILICLDGASLDVISPAVAAGRLPNFGRLLDRGASLHLATTRPTQPEPAWASVVTGKWPARHGVRSGARYRPYAGGPALDILPDYLFSHALVRYGFLVEEPHTSGSLHASPLWVLLGSRQMRSGVVGLPLTHPAAPVAGFVVSDRFYAGSEGAPELYPRPAVYPTDMDSAARAALSDEDGPGARPRLDPAVVPAAWRRALEADRVRHRLARRFGANVRLLAVRYAGLDAIGHYYLPYAQPDTFGGVAEQERRAQARVLDDYYGYADSIVGDALATMREGDLLLVVSAFGMEPLPAGKRMLERIAGDPRFAATHERAPDGFALAYGRDVATGRLVRGAVVDVVPTLLYFFGLPIGRDMDGFARADMFTAAFNAPRTFTFIPSYESAAVR